MKTKRSLLIALLLLVCACDRNDELFIPDFEVYAVLPAEGLGDRSFVDVVYEGIEVAKNHFNFKVTYILPDNLAAGREWIAGIAGLKPEAGSQILVIIGGNQYVTAVQGLNGAFGACRLLLLAGEAPEQDGLASVTYRTFAPSYLGGYLAAKRIPGCRALAVEAFNAPFLNDFEAGFGAGVTDAGGTLNPTVYLAQGFEGFSMPDSAYDLTNSLLPDNDLIFALADGSNFGIINAARDYPQPRYVLGVDTDQSWMGLQVVSGSVIIHYGLEIFEYIEAFAGGSFASGSFVRSMADGKTAFKPNPVVMGNLTIPDSLIQQAIRKEKAHR